MIVTPAYPILLHTIVLTLSFWCWIALEAYLILRDRPAAGDVLHDRGTRLWNFALLAAGITLGLNMTRIAPQSDIQPFNVFFILGIILVWAGLLFRIWAVRTLGRFFRTKVTIQEGHALVTIGPYRYLRNPSYTGMFIILAGFGFAVGNWVSIIVLLTAAVGAFSRRINVEDAALAARFGKEYEAYRTRTWAMIPFIW